MQDLSIHKRIIKRIARINYVKRAIREQADLSEFKKKPTPRIIMGVSAIALSYVIGWPAISAAASVSIWLNQSWIALIAGPVLYGLSHLTFLLGMYLAGEKYTRIFLRWATRVGVERLIRLFSLEEDILGP